MNVTTNILLAFVVMVLASFCSGFIQAIADSILHVKVNGSPFAISLSIALRNGLLILCTVIFVLILTR